jgi:hypothetical protein
MTRNPGSRTKQETDVFNPMPASGYIQCLSSATIPFPILIRYPENDQTSFVYESIEQDETIERNEPTHHDEHAEQRDIGRAHNMIYGRFDWGKSRMGPGAGAKILPIQISQYLRTSPWRTIVLFMQLSGQSTEIYTPDDINLSCQKDEQVPLSQPDVLRYTRTAG